MTEQAQVPVEPPKKARIRLGRIAVAFVVLAALAGAAYVASWLNARRFYLIVEADRVRVHKGQMLPVGHKKYTPQDEALRQAYAEFRLPEGLRVPNGETAFTDRVELDQALFRLLRDSTVLVLRGDSDQSLALAPGYLKQLRALPGVNLSQHDEIGRFEHDLLYLKARSKLRAAEKLLEEARKLFRESSRDGGGRHADGEQKALRIDRALSELAAREEPAAREPIEPSPTPTETSTRSE